MYNLRFKHKLDLYFISDFCTMDAYLANDAEAWIDNDGLPGFSTNDTAVHVGDHLDVLAIVQLDTCREW